ncbi:Fatty acid oxidation complex subunit alpha [Streptomyces antimycoticus]
MTAAMWAALPPLLDALAGDPGVRALVLAGEGGTFCAGADISTLQGSPVEAQRLAVAAEEALAAFPRPTLAAVRGHCVGGGAQLAAACDLRFAEQGALFGATPARLGIVYPASATRRLVSLVGPATAKYLLFGELIDAERALRTGLVDEVLPEGELGKRVAEFTRILRVPFTRLAGGCRSSELGGVQLQVERLRECEASAEGMGAVHLGVAEVPGRRIERAGALLPVYQEIQPGSRYSA